MKNSGRNPLLFMCFLFFSSSAFSQEGPPADDAARSEVQTASSADVEARPEEREGPPADVAEAPPRDAVGSGKAVFTLRECLQKAVAESDKIKVSDIEADVRENERKSMRGHYFPKIVLDGKIIKFNDSVNLDVDMSFLNVLLQDFTSFMSTETLTQLAAFQQKGLKIKVRDDFMYEGGVTVAQPLGQLFSIYSGERARQALVEAAQKEGVSVRRKVELDVVKAYVGLVAAVNMQKTIEAALVQLDSMEKQVEAYLNAELVERNALLKVQVAKAEYQKSLFSAQKGSDLARAALNMLMGRPLEAPLEPSVESVVLDFEGSDADASLSALQKKAVAERPELDVARASIKAARYAKNAAIGKMIPELNLIFRYHNTQGTGQMQPENEYFGGLVMTWNIWDWGVDYYEMRAAKSRREKAEAKTAEAEKMIRLEVQSKWLDLKEARKSTAVSQKQADLAEENLRIVKMRYDVTEATTTELLEAQTLQLKAANDLIIAKVNVDAALYSLAVAGGLDLLN